MNEVAYTHIKESVNVSHYYSNYQCVRGMLVPLSRYRKTVIPEEVFRNPVALSATSLCVEYKFGVTS